MHILENAATSRLQGSMIYPTMRNLNICDDSAISFNKLCSAEWKKVQKEANKFLDLQWHRWSNESQIGEDMMMSKASMKYLSACP